MVICRVSLKRSHWTKKGGRGKPFSHSFSRLYVSMLSKILTGSTLVLIFFVCLGSRYIKDYDGGILMECKIDPKLPYVDLATMIRRQRQVK